jgi:hypothetical protein
MMDFVWDASFGRKIFTQRGGNDVKRYILFGAGSTGKRALDLLGEYCVECFCDNQRIGTKLCQKKVISFSELKSLQKEFQVLITVAQPGFSKEIECQLKQANIPYTTFSDFCLNYFSKLRDLGDVYYLQYEKEINYMLECNTLPMLPYSFCKKYAQINIGTTYDTVRQMYYCELEKKKLYFPFENKADVENCMRALLAEQDEESPHRYFDTQHIPGKKDVFVDVGSAEGLLALAVVDKVKKVYLFEGDQLWINALEATFEPYKDKVVCVPKMVGDIESINMVTADSVLADVEENLFFKVDIEGHEGAFLRGAKKSLGRCGTRISLCTYHKAEDAPEFDVLLSSMDYNTCFSKGWIFAGGDFQRGVLKGCKR